MVAVYRHQGESFDSLLKRFKKGVRAEKLMKYVRKQRYYEKPSAQRKRKAIKKRIKSIKTTRKMQAR